MIDVDETKVEQQLTPRHDTLRYAMLRYTTSLHQCWLVWEKSTVHQHRTTWQNQIVLVLVRSLEARHFGRDFLPRSSEDAQCELYKLSLSLLFPPWAKPGLDERRRSLVCSLLIVHSGSKEDKYFKYKNLTESMPCNAERIAFEAMLSYY